ncbi:hypothetical protein EVAR_79928_1 [Eumeta japonica]|uniref:Uncharacterized protein n=1 Tax=Eumeta variegata TaxID=151549 RepID=A0A4C1U0F2_EUMVA|nr:hypothetical protein EVAR_79928_1 [Eumeta japonica]
MLVTGVCQPTAEAQTCTLFRFSRDDESGNDRDWQLKEWSKTLLPDDEVLRSVFDYGRIDQPVFSFNQIKPEPWTSPLSPLAAMVNSKLLPIYALA